MSHWISLKDYKLNESVLTKKSSYTMDWDDDFSPKVNKKEVLDSDFDDSHKEKSSKDMASYRALSKKREELKRQLKEVEASMIRFIQMHNR